MKTIQQSWHGTLVLLSLYYQTAFAFNTPQPTTWRRSSTQEHRLLVDPNDVASIMVSSTHGISTEMSALLTTTLSTAIPLAHGHSNPVFGPPDPYLAAGKSIAPSVQALVDSMGVALPLKTATVGNLLPDATPEVQQSVAQALKRGWNLLDASRIQGTGQNHLPGFAETRGILGTRMEALAVDSPPTFAAEVQWANQFLPVMDRLPFVAFYYALVEFFLLRPGVDLYKEEIEDDPEGVAADTVSVGIVRLGVFAVISFLTVTFS